MVVARFCFIYIFKKKKKKKSSAGQFTSVFGPFTDLEVNFSASLLLFPLSRPFTYLYLNGHDELMYVTKHVERVSVIHSLCHLQCMM